MPAESWRDISFSCRNVNIVDVSIFKGENFTEHVTECCLLYFHIANRFCIITLKKIILVIFFSFKYLHLKILICMIFAISQLKPILHKKMNIANRLFSILNRA